MMLRVICLALLSLSSSSAAISIAARNRQLVDCLKSSLSPQGSILCPEDPDFVTDTTRFSPFHSPTFSVVSRVSNDQDLRASINCANKTKTPFLLTGPRHGFYTGFDQLNNGLEIYTGAFNHIDVDLGTNTMTIGGAAVFKDVSNTLQAAGRNIPVGGGPCVGMVGATMGGGIGRLEGLYGLMVDSLLSVRIMLPDTTVIEVSEETNPELFWGIRGAGFNFGYVLNATYRVYDAVPNGMNFNADFEFPLNLARAFYGALKDQTSKLPAPLCLATDLSWSSTLNATTLKVNAVYAGPEAEGRQAVQFLEELGESIRQNFTEVPWNEVSQNAFFLAGNEAILACGETYGKRAVLGAAFNDVDVDAHVKMTELFDYMVNKYPQMRASDNSMYFCATKAVRALPDDATAFAWRRAVGHQTWGIVYGDGTTTDASIEHLPQKMRATIAGSACKLELKTYVGFSNGDEPLESIFSKDHLPRLAALKKTYDPHGLFNAYHPLPTSYP